MVAARPRGGVDPSRGAPGVGPARAEDLSSRPMAVDAPVARAGRTRAALPPRPGGAASALVVVVVLGALYASTMLRDVGGPTDTAKFQYLGTVLGTAHQPGYPTYTMLLALAVRLVPGEDALVADGVSAACTIAAAVVLLRLLQLLGVRPPLAVAGALLLGVTRTVWSQAVIAEVYGLHLLLVLVVLLLVARWARRRRRRDLVLGLAVWAFSFSHATSAVLLAPGVLALVLLVDRRALLDRKVLRWAPAYAAAALLPYGYILWRTLDPSTTYLEARFRSLREFVGMVRGEVYSGQMFAFSPTEMVTSRAAVVWQELVDQPLAWALVPALVAVVARRRDPVVWLLVLLVASVAVWGAGYDIPDVAVVFVPGYAALVALAALGAEVVLRRVPAALAAAAAVAALAVPAVVALDVHDDEDVDLSEDPAAAEVRQALDVLGEDGGVVWTTQYHQLNYHLLGQGRQSELDVYAVYPEPFEGIAAYCRGEGVGVGQNRTVATAPTGLPLYAFGAPYISGLRGLGYDLEPVTDELVEISCSSGAAAAP